jgi:hypothetical protein
MLASSKTLGIPSKQEPAPPVLEKVDDSML